ncbi:hypothetical protein MRX96_025664 [Rhipicephalus microplus]
MLDGGPMDSTTDTPLVRSVTPFSDAITATLTPSEYETLTNSRERFVVLTLSALLLFISGCLFGILVSLLSDDRASPNVYWPSSLELNIAGSRLLLHF